MKTEFEVKLLDIDVEKVKEKLEELGATKIAERNMRRHVYDIDPADQSTWIRLRNNGKKTTLTIKELHDESIDGTKEIEVDVGHFEDTNLILNKLGFFSKGYQENKRISYLLDRVEIEIDSWPKIPPYVEVEGKSIEDVEKVVKLLGFDMSQTSTLCVRDVYTKYGIDIHSFKTLKFD